MAARKLVSGDEAEIAMRQPTEPCSDCPFSRNSLPGWLGALSVDDWIRSVHGEALIDCHAIKAEDGSAFQCAGAAIYRANVAKKCRPANRRIRTSSKQNESICFANGVSRASRGELRWLNQLKHN